MARHIAAVAVMLCLSPVLAQAQGDALTITAPSASVYKSPTTASPVIGRAAKGDSLEVTRDVGDWVKVAWPADPSGVGYVREALGTRGRAVASAKAAAPAASANEVARRASISPAADTRAAVTSPQAVGTVPARVAQAGYVSRPRHVIGVGAAMHGPSLGLGASVRGWSPGWLGVQLDLSRYTVSTPLDPQQMTTTQFAPSVLFRPTDVMSDYVWMRPYAGAGISMYRSSLATPTVGVSVSDSHMGYQFFGGVEFTAASLPSLGVSVDVGYRSFNTPFAGFDLGGSSVGIAAHWYVK